MQALIASLAERLAALRGVEASALPRSLLDVRVVREDGLVLVRPADWDALRHDEGGAGRGVPYWARPWPSGLALAAEVSEAAPGGRVLELGCGLGAPSIAAALAGADVLATDGVTDAVAFAAHSMALNAVEGEVAQADWAEHGDVLVERGPWDVVLAADVFYTGANVHTGLRLLPRLGAEIWLADPGRAGTRDFLAAARGLYRIRPRRRGDVTVYVLTPR